MEELTDHIGHVGWKDEQEETQRHCSEVLPQTLVSGCSQGQDYGVSYLQHGLQDGSNNNKEDDREKEGSVDDLKLNEASLDSKDQQGDAFCHSPVHGVVIHKGSVTLKVELAECEDSQSNERDSENQTQ